MESICQLHRSDISEIHLPLIPGLQSDALTTVIDEAVSGLDRHLLETLFSRYSLHQHCDALKRYMLLGQGDFIESLMDMVGPQLDKPVCGHSSSTRPIFVQKCCDRHRKWHA